MHVLLSCRVLGCPANVKHAKITQIYIKGGWWKDRDNTTTTTYYANWNNLPMACAEKTCAKETSDIVDWYRRYRSDYSSDPERGYWYPEALKDAAEAPPI